MKKLSLGLALMNLAGMAAAQSSVTIHGVLDTGISHYRVSGGDSMTALSDHGNTSSRLGFRGRENLGNGMTALFWLEGGVDPSSPGTFAFTRRSAVGLSGAFGEVRLGRDYTPSYNHMSAFGGPWITNGVGENLLYRARAVSHNSSNGGQSTNVRASNAINYFLPKNLGGLSGQFMYGFDEALEGHPGRFIGGRLAYKHGGLTMGISYNTVEGGPNAPASRPRDMKNLALGAAYQFSFGKLSTLYINDRIEMPGGDKKLTGLSVGLAVPLGAGTVRASYARVKFDHVNDQSKAQKVALGYVYDLSKRTALYSTVAYIDNDRGASFVTGGPAGLPNRSATGIDFGLRHNF